MKKLDFYNVIYDFCEKKGLINKLNKRLKETNLDVIQSDNIDSVGLDVLDAVHCLTDKKRTFAFLDEIERTIKPNTNVLEIGLGTAVMSLYSAYLGARVVGIEINRDTYDLANSITDMMVEKGIVNRHNISIQCIDFFKFNSKEKFDVIISENIYTGLFREKQAQIMLRAQKYLGEHSITIPQKIESYISIVNVDFPEVLKDGEEYVPSEEKGNELIYNNVSDTVKYDSINFNNMSRIGVDKFLLVNRTIKGGNAFMLYSNVIMSSGLILKHNDVTFMNNKIFVAMGSNKIPKSKRIKLHIKYDYGDSTDKALFKFAE